MKFALSFSFFFIVAEGLLPQMQRVVSKTGLHSSAALDHELRSFGWIPRRFRKEEDGMVSAMAMLKQAKIELSELSLQEVPKEMMILPSSIKTNSPSRPDEWEQTVFSAMQHLELQIEQSAQTTGERSLQFWKTTVVEPLSKWSLPQLSQQWQSPETMERAVFDEMERLETMIEQNAFRTGTYVFQLVQAAMEAIRPQAQEVKIRWTQQLVSIIRDMADQLERQVEPVVEKDPPAVVITSVYHTRPVPPRRRRRRRPGIITSFVTRMIRNVRAKWHGA
ncbi:hypothetical protein FisN_9Lh199 [Fistulifera solaris]|uniref:Uncharacterized protein n=1 Tax=Fistulifera solaris TaxID=1519565 RepID=A0A1Z5KKR4_FISSO|nr:hypothetical protein FisN_9Lh199 [Fistulifera solaris]|eukprot:GAX26903.1 hypothetical protein FisN_9Lh199 [Fistulifera solaris]